MTATAAGTLKPATTEQTTITTRSREVDLAGRADQGGLLRRASAGCYAGVSCILSELGHERRRTFHLGPWATHPIRLRGIGRWFSNTRRGLRLYDRKIFLLPRVRTMMRKFRVAASAVALVGALALSACEH